MEALSRFRSLQNLRIFGRIREENDADNYHLLADDIFGVINDLPCVLNGSLTELFLTLGAVNGIRILPSEMTARCLSGLELVDMADGSIFTLTSRLPMLEWLAMHCTDLQSSTAFESPASKAIEAILRQCRKLQKVYLLSAQGKPSDYGWLRSFPMEIHVFGMDGNVMYKQKHE